RPANTRARRLAHMRAAGRARAPLLRCRHAIATRGTVMPCGPVIGRRAFSLMAASLAAAPVLAPAARAEIWPARPVRLLVPFAPGGSHDATAGLIGAQLTGGWGRPVVVENKPGAGTHLASDLVAKAAPDGYTVLITAATMPIGRHLYKSLPYEISDLAPV